MTATISATAGATMALAAFAAEARLEDFPERTVQVAEQAILDTVGVALASLAEPTGEILVDHVRRLGGEPTSVVWGTGVRVPAPNAALACGTMAHALDFDDMHTGSAGHPSTVLVPAALPVGEQRRAGGRAVLEAYLVGFEVVYRVGRAMGMTALANGFHPTGLWAPLGAAVTSARLLGLDAAATATAMGIAGSQAAGLRGNFGTMVKPFHAGFGAMAGVTAAMLAHSGFSASRSIVEGKDGILDVFGDDVDGGLVIEGLGEEFFPAAGYALKVYPSCGKTHCGIDAALSLRENHALRVEDIDLVEIEASPSVGDVLVHHRPATALEGKFSLEYCVAVALADGAAGLAQFTDGRVADPALQDLVARCRLVERDGGGWDDFMAPERVTVALRDGSRLSAQVDRADGDLARPVSPEEVVAKFRDCARRALPETAVERVIDQWRTFENLTDVRDFTAPLAVR